MAAKTGVRSPLGWALLFAGLAIGLTGSAFWDRTELAFTDPLSVVLIVIAAVELVGPYFAHGGRRRMR